ncbi:MAG: glycosyl transferase family 4 [Betaproteobacteria bacterium RBG_16_56_24]|nr:MAG: glycosyl transferase family 4 [Betaproteobacteria bacterium RBG_16_56_24]
MTHYAPMISALVTLLLTLLLTLSKTGLIQDVPNERSLHTEPVPRTGGIALMAGILSGWMMLIRVWPWWVVLPALGLFILSLVDDMRGLSPGARLAGHFIAALLVLWGAGVGWLWLLPVLLFIVWMTNLYNFMDGSDGLAGGMTFFGFSFYGVAGFMAGDDALAMMSFAVSSAALAFLFFNSHPAKIFMGDAGSIPLGFLAAAFGVWGWQQGFWPFWFPLLVFSPFVVDATATLLKRMRRGEKLTQAHRSHYYQRLVQMGWGHRNTALAEYVLMFFAGISALRGIGMDVQGQGNLLAWWGAIYLGLSMWVDRCWGQHEAAKEKSAGNSGDA